jgi:hypothetical protein
MWRASDPDVEVSGVERPGVVLLVGALGVVVPPGVPVLAAGVATGLSPGNPTTLPKSLNCGRGVDNDALMP